MSTFTYAEALKEIREIAKSSGLTFKRQSHSINGKASYKFVDRETGEAKLENVTLWSAYENCMCGYISSYNRKTRKFN